MILRLCLFLFVLSPLTIKLNAGILDVLQNSFNKEAPFLSEPTIRVLIKHDQPNVILEVKGQYKIYDPRTGRQISSGLSGKRRMVEPLEIGLRWGEEFPGIHQFVVVPVSSKGTTIVDGVEYHGEIYVYDIGGSISVVSKVDIEEYLSSILPQRYPEPLPSELQAAIAITGRTNSYYEAQSGKNPYWDVDAEKEKYYGYALGATSTGFENAISGTRHMVLHRVGSEGEWLVTPFAVDWRPSRDGRIYKGIMYSNITVEEAESMAKKGSNAVAILGKAFPSTSFRLMR